MEKLKLTDICDFQGGSQPPKEQWTNELKDGYIRMLQIRDFTQGKNNNEYVKISNTLKTCEDDDILIARYGASVGKVLSGLSGAYNVAIIKSIPDISKVLKRYLYYYFNTDYFQNRIKSVGSRAAQAGFNKTDLEDFEIGIPSLIEQQKIIEILDKSQELIKKRKKQIQALDELVKSKFIEMFGDPFRNPKGWTVKQLKEIILLANNGLARRGNDKDGNIVLRLVELQDGFIDYSSPNRIRLTESEEKRYLLQDGDFLFARVNGNPDNVGRCSAYEDIGESVYHNDHIIRVRLDKKIVNNDYVSAILNSPYGKLQMKDKLKTSAGQYTINQNGISEIKITIPPIELQNKFADFVKQVDKLKFAMEKSLKELENNFNSLMQKAFKGELFN